MLCGRDTFAASTRRAPVTAMHIKKLEISGFKSFCDRTVVHFDHDIVGVVGPNGCGKSNIVDALRWCMGEQSAKQLRGRSMDDVIFSGSESRSPQTMAEVTLTFANDDRELASNLPLEYRDFPEISVTRRLYRDGTSEYLINKTQVRLKDVTDLFLGTGVGTRAYSIVEQGKIGLIVSAKPQERRLLIEEAAGITKYKHRKKQAETKMDLTRQNLLRVGDIVAEIERNLSSLKRQAAKAERYLNYRKEHDDLVLHEASHKLLEIIAVEKVERSAGAESGETASRKKAELDAREATLEAARAEAFELEQETEKRQNAAFLADNEVRTCEAESARGRDRLQHLAEKQRTATAEAAKIEGNQTQLEAELRGIQSAVHSLESQEAVDNEKLRIEETRLAALEAEQRSVTEAAAALRQTFAKSAATAAAAQERLSGFERRISDMRLRRERLTIDSQRFGEDVDEAERKRLKAEQHCRELDEDQRNATDQVESLNAELKQLRESIVSRERELDAAKHELSQARSRLRALEEVHSRFEGVGTGPKALLELGDESVAGLAADIVEAPEHLIGAFAGLLGNRLQAVLVRDPGRIPSLLQKLADRKAGRATVLPLHPVFVSGRGHSLPSVPGVIGRIADQLTYTAEHEPIVRLLADDALVAENVEAVARLREAGVRDTTVTLDGTVFWADGRVSGGAGDAQAAALLQQKRQLRELRTAAGICERRAEEALNAHTELRTTISERGAALDKARTFEREVQIEKVNAEGELRRAQDQISSVRARLAEISRETEDLDGKLEEAGFDYDQAQALLGRAREQADKSSQSTTEIEARVRDAGERVAEQVSICTERKVAFATIKQQCASARQTGERLARSIDELATRAAQLGKEAVDSARAQGEVAAQLMALRERLQDALTAASEARVEFEKRRKALDDVRNTLSVFETEIKLVRTELGEVMDKARAHDMALQRLDLQRNHLLAGVAEKFRGLNLARVVGDYHMRPAPDAEHRARIQELANLIERIGPVNLDATQEYEKAAERFQFYTTQKNDLEKALQDLEHAIQQMNRESKRLFRETFDTVNAQFQVLFPKMFRGGQARLVLTNPEDLLETGIEIQAQPPGKKVSSIELLSGGEKALTAVSLIFAIFQCKPSPFCVLDEVDAPLDEANVSRFAEAVRGMTDRSQFIVITHIKRTMQMVDVMYGVTMQEPGVSRVVSVKVNQSAQRRSDHPAASAKTADAVA